MAATVAPAALALPPYRLAPCAPFDAGKVVDEDVVRLTALQAGSHPFLPLATPAP